jgi:hypothetical protein
MHKLINLHLEEPKNSSAEIRRNRLLNWAVPWIKKNILEDSKTRLLLVQRLDASTGCFKVILWRAMEGMNTLGSPTEALRVGWKFNSNQERKAFAYRSSGFSPQQRKEKSRSCLIKVHTELLVGICN